MHVLCPQCRSPIEVASLSPSGELACPACGSTFRLEGGSTTGWERGPGRKFGKFELIDVVGQGAFGTVYKARDTELDRVVALKVPRADALPRAQDHDRFLREARSAAQMRHPSIVSLHEVGQAEGVTYLVSDFVEGNTLADVLSAGRPDFRRAAELTAAVAEALQYAHERGVVHRDVKPSNIMIGPDGRPVVLDFGLARREAGEVTMTVEGQVLGTPAYMPPEQAAGDAHKVDARGDVYSLGVVLYQLLTGELPFRGTTRMLLHQVLHDDPKPPRRLNDRIPRELEVICLKAMAKEPPGRYATAGELADDLRRFLAGEPIRARPIGWLRRGWRWCRRHPAPAALIVSTGLLLVATTAGALLYARAAAAHARAQAVNDHIRERIRFHEEELDRLHQARREAEAEVSRRQSARIAYEEQLPAIRARHQQGRPKPAAAGATPQELQEAGRREAEWVRAEAELVLRLQELHVESIRTQARVEVRTRQCEEFSKRLEEYRGMLLPGP